MSAENDYPYIRAWCRLMHSAPYYLERELTRAKAEGAPADAIASSPDGWKTLADVYSTGTRTLLERFVNEAKGDGR